MRILWLLFFGMVVVSYLVLGLTGCRSAGDDKGDTGSATASETTATDTIEDVNAQHETEAGGSQNFDEAKEDQATDKEDEDLTPDESEESESRDEENESHEESEAEESADNVPTDEQETADFEDETNVDPDDEENIREGDTCDPEGEGDYCLDENTIVRLDEGGYDEEENGLVCMANWELCNSDHDKFCAKQGAEWMDAVLKPRFVCNDDDPTHVFCEWIEDVLVDDCEQPGEPYCGEDENADQLLQAKTRFCVEDGWRTHCEPDTFHVVEDCPINGEACYDGEEGIGCEAVDPCYFLELKDPCETGDEGYCYSDSTGGDWMVSHEGVCGYSEMTIVCLPTRELCEENTHCVVNDGIASCQ